MNTSNPLDDSEFNRLKQELTKFQVFEININTDYLNNTSINKITQMQNVSYLYISGTNCDDSDVIDLDKNSKQKKCVNQQNKSENKNIYKPQSTFQKISFFDKVNNLLGLIVNNKKHTTITGLRMSGLYLTEIPDNLYKFTNLETLNLNNNKLTELSERLCELTNLKELLLLNNPIDDANILKSNFINQENSKIKIADCIIYNSDFILIEKNLGEYIKKYILFKIPAPVPEPEPESLYTEQPIALPPEPELDSDFTPPKEESTQKIESLQKPEPTPEPTPEPIQEPIQEPTPQPTQIENIQKLNESKNIIINMPVEDGNIKYIKPSEPKKEKKTLQKIIKDNIMSIKKMNIKYVAKHLSKLKKLKNFFTNLFKKSKPSSSLTLKDVVGTVYHDNDTASITAESGGEDNENNNIIIGFENNQWLLNKEIIKENIKNLIESQNYYVDCMGGNIYIDLLRIIPEIEGDINGFISKKNIDIFLNQDQKKTFYIDKLNVNLVELIIMPNNFYKYIQENEIKNATFCYDFQNKLQEKINKIKENKPPLIIYEIKSSKFEESSQQPPKKTSWFGGKRKTIKFNQFKKSSLRRFTKNNKKSQKTLRRKTHKK